MHYSLNSDALRRMEVMSFDDLGQLCGSMSQLYSGAFSSTGQVIMDSYDKSFLNLRNDKITILKGIYLCVES